jgi:hypothetical protein
MFSRKENKKAVVIKADETADFKILEKVRRVEIKKSVNQVSWIMKSLQNCNIFQDMDVNDLYLAYNSVSTS